MRLAGIKTGKFSGAGMTVSLDHYRGHITETRADILFYEKVEKKLYHCPYTTFVQNSFNHVQDFNSQPVQVIPFDNKNRYFERWG
jgi:hypothetical protein